MEKLKYKMYISVDKSNDILQATTIVSNNWKSVHYIMLYIPYVNH